MIAPGLVPGVHGGQRFGDRPRGHGEVLTPQLRRPPVQQHNALDLGPGYPGTGRPGQRRGIQVSSGGPGLPDGRGRGEFPVRPGVLSQLQQDGQREGAVAAEQYLPRPGAVDLAYQRAGRRFLRADGILEPQRRRGDVLIPPATGLPGIVDAGNQVRRVVGVRDLPEDFPSGVQDAFIVRRLRAQGVQVTEPRPGPPAEQRPERARRPGAGHHNLRSGGASGFQQRMAPVGLDHHDAVPGPAGSQAPQQRDSHRIQAGENRGIFHRAEHEHTLPQPGHPAPGERPPGRRPPSRLHATTCALARSLP